VLWSVSCDVSAVLPLTFCPSSPVTGPSAAPALLPCRCFWVPGPVFSLVCLWSSYCGGAAATGALPAPVALAFVPRLRSVARIAPYLNSAPTDLAALIVTLHSPVPEQAPDQPPKLEPLAATAFSVTSLFVL
jgi:hypothetical protein